MIFVAGLAFIVLLYLFPLYSLAAAELLVFPVLGRRGSWLLTAGLLYLTLVLLARLADQFDQAIWPAWPRYRRSLTRRTGIHKLDTVGFRFSLLAIVLFTAVDLEALPLALAAAIGFSSLRSQEVTVRKVRNLRLPERRDGPKKQVAAEEPVTRNFTWQFKEAFGHPYHGNIELTVDKRRYEKQKAENPYADGRPSTRQYGRLIAGGLTEEVRFLADTLRAVARDEGFSSYQELANTLAFIQAIPYRDDGESKGREYVRWPIETIYEQSADADCKAVLLGALLVSLGYRPAIVEAPGRIAVAVGGAGGMQGRFLVFRGERYYYCDVSATNAPLGQLPVDIDTDQLKVYELPAGKALGRED